MAVSVGKLISLREHLGQFLLLKREEKAWTYKIVLAISELLISSFSRHGSKHFMFTKLNVFFLFFFGEKAVKIGRRLFIKNP